jgi:hypothetical protein
MSQPSKKPAEAPQRTPKGRFAPGVSGNPRGKPKGTLRRTTRLAQELLDAHAPELVMTAISKALDGDIDALRLCIARLVPPTRERSLDVELSKIKTPADLPGAVSRLLDLVATGELAPTEAERIAGILGAWREATQLVDLEARLAALEAGKP